MTKFVFEAEILVPEWKRHWRHYYLDEQLAQKLIAELPPECAGLVQDVHELRDLLTTQGEVSTMVKLSNSQQAVMRMLTAMARAAWRDSIPWDLEEINHSHKGDEQFGSYLRAYVISEENYKSCMERMK